MKKDKVKVYVYTRVSTAVQVDGYSLEAQRTRMKAFADFNDFEIAHEYEDAGKSGKSIEGRLEFNRMMEDIKSVKMECLMCWCSSCHVLAEMRQMCFPPYR
jgi:Site-specific recombinases, DNA invertase Pin homologs